jgi:acyl dehydratase
MIIERNIRAFNTATESENRIHDDETAARFGFTGGLVPGVDVFAYMAHAPVKAWGETFLTGGSMNARFGKPVYDGDVAQLFAEEFIEGALSLELRSQGTLCATGGARVKALTAEVAIPPRGRQPAEADRPKASLASLPVGKVLGYPMEVYTTRLGREHLDAVREDSALFDHGRVCNPAYLLRRANYILASNVLLGPWIHVASDIRLHGLVVDGETLDVRAQVARNVEHKGHLIVTLDVAILADDRLVMSGTHEAIYEPRQVRERTTG